MSTISRRDVINTLAGSVVATALGSPLQAKAQPGESESQADRQILTQPAFNDFREFIRVSGALTGIDSQQLAPDSRQQKDQAGKPVASGADPTQAVKLAYYNLATTDPSYEQLVKDFSARLPNGGASVATADQLDGAATTLIASNNPGVRNLARSIIMAWYFGLWYEWDADGKVIRYTVISAEAHTQGWVWRIAQAHPEGYSNLRFGHWAFAPAVGFDLSNILLKNEVQP